MVRAEQASGPVAGVIVQLGGQTPLGLARALAAARVPVVGTSPEAIHLAEDRAAFARVLENAGLTAPRYGTATSTEDAVAIAREIGYPVLGQNPAEQVAHHLWWRLLQQLLGPEPARRQAHPGIPGVDAH